MTESSGDIVPQLPAKLHHVTFTGVPAACASCGTVFATRYCPECGEAKPDERQYTMRHFAEEALEAFSHADGRLLGTLRTLVTAPGALTVAYMKGARKPFASPLQIFLIINVAYFLVVAVTHVNTFGTPLRFHVQGTPYQAIAQSLVKSRLAARHTTFDQYANTFDHAALLQAKSLVIVLCPIFALLTALVMLPRRRFAVEYLVFALHAMSLLLLIVMLVHVAGIAVLAISGWRGASYGWQTVDEAETLLTLVIIGSYLRFAVARVFGVNGGAAVARALLLSVAIVVTVFTYRGILFFITFATT